MTTEEIIAELAKLTRQELERVNSKLRDLLAAPEVSRIGARSLRKFAGTVQGLPPDMARNHDQYRKVRQKGRRHFVSGYDLVKHLCGSLKGGPTDLATNPANMKGFGE